MKKRGCEFERKKGRAEERILREETIVGNDVIITVISKIKIFNEYFCFLSLTRRLLLTRHQKYPRFYQQFCLQKCFKALAGVTISCFLSPFS